MVSPELFRRDRKDQGQFNRSLLPRGKFSPNSLILAQLLEKSTVAAAQPVCNSLCRMVFRHGGAESTTLHQGVQEFYQLLCPGQVGVIDRQFALFNQIGDYDLAP